MRDFFGNPLITCVHVIRDKARTVGPKRSYWGTNKEHNYGSMYESSSFLNARWFDTVLNANILLLLWVLPV